MLLCARLPPAGLTPLWIAAYGGHAQVVQMLLAAGAAKEEASAEGVTPRSIALEQGHTSVAELL